MSLILIAGPCVIEDEDITMDIAKQMKQITEKLDVDYYFKASFDKANRTSIHSFRGLGLDEGLRILKKVKKEYKLKICTDIHESDQAAPVAKVVDMLQIPSFLSRQTDLIVAAAKTGLPLHIKKGEFLAPKDMKFVLEKAIHSGGKDVYLCERGTSFGYNNLVVDMTSIIEMKKLGCPVIFDATHSVQKPGGKGSSSGGNIEYVRPLSRAAIAVGVDGLFMEIHPNPNKAKSDSSCMIRLDEIEKLLDELLELYRMVKPKI